METASRQVGEALLYTLSSGRCSVIWGVFLSMGRWLNFSGSLFLGSSKHNIEWCTQMSAALCPEKQCLLLDIPGTQKQLWFLLGPRSGTTGEPAGIAAHLQRWCPVLASPWQRGVLSLAASTEGTVLCNPAAVLPGSCRQPNSSS